MSSLVLVRHGQASFFSDNYDQLSPLGEEQARLLGQYWVKRGVRFDRVFTGPRVRQIETAALAGEAFVKAGFEWPEPVRIDELDEHQVDRLIKMTMPQIALEYPDIGKLHEAYVAAESPRDRHRTFQLMFERVVILWTEGKVAAPGIESWQAFRQRVANGLKRMTGSGERGQNVVAFTSVGAVTACLQVSLGCTDRMALDLGWRVRNCTLTEFLFSGDRLTLEGFNAYPHLEDLAMVTYR